MKSAFALLVFAAVLSAGCADVEPQLPNAPEPALHVLNPPTQFECSNITESGCIEIHNPTGFFIHKVRWKFAGKDAEASCFTADFHPIPPMSNGEIRITVLGSISTLPGTAELVSVEYNGQRMKNFKPTAREMQEAAKAQYRLDHLSPSQRKTEGEIGDLLMGPDVPVCDRYTDVQHPNRLSEDFELRNAVWTSAGFEVGFISFELRYVGPESGHLSFRNPEVLFKTGKREYVCTPDMFVDSRFQIARQFDVPVLALMEEPQIIEVSGLEPAEQADFEKKMTTWREESTKREHDHKAWEARQAKKGR